MRKGRLFRLFKRAGLLVLFALGLVASVLGTRAASLVEGNSAFALDLYAQLSSAPGNVFFSPYSISTCLAMTYAGARGNTAAEMARVLHFDAGDARLYGSFGKLQRQVSEAEKQPGIELEIANALWAQKDEPLLPAFLKVANDDYQASVEQADFKTSADVVARKINQWVAQKTKDRIQEILSPGSLDRDTRLVLANAIYFKGRWANPFWKAGTSSQPFHLSRGDEIMAPLMHTSDDVKYFEDGGLQALELPYNGGELSMVILLPRKINALPRMERKLKPKELDFILAKMKKQTVEIFLPKFKEESDFVLNDTLAKMGMPDAFNGATADFSGLNGKRDLYISHVLHKAWVEVTEEGTEAAVATIVLAEHEISERPPPPPIFRADHPFIFLIRDIRSGSLLFIGRLADPRD